MEKNHLISICVLVFGLVATFWIDTSYKYRMAQLEAQKAISTTKAEEGLKFKFGLTKEKE